MAKLIGFLKDPIEGMRLYANASIRNICMVVPSAKQDFIKADGLVLFVNMLDKFTPNAESADMQLEALLNLQDMLEDDNKEMVPAHCKQVVRELTPKLEKLKSHDDQDIKESADTLLFRVKANSR